MEVAPVPDWGREHCQPSSAPLVLRWPAVAFLLRTFSDASPLVVSLLDPALPCVWMWEARQVVVA